MTSSSELKDIKLSLKKNGEESSALKDNICRLGETAPDYMHKDLLALREERNLIRQKEIIMLQRQGGNGCGNLLSRPCRLLLPYSNCAWPGPAQMHNTELQLCPIYTDKEAAMAAAASNRAAADASWLANCLA